MRLKTRLTPQRRAILEELRKAKDHPSAGELYRRVQAKLPGIGFATVYKTLNLMAQQGNILELSFGDAASHFDGNPQPHSHGLCTRCGAIVDMEVALPLQTLAEAARDATFQPTGYRLEFYGLCGRCQEKGEKKGGSHDEAL